jgi:hypothetical protein
MAWLTEALPENQQDGRASFVRRCQKDVVEERAIRASA